MAKAAAASVMKRSTFVLAEVAGAKRKLRAPVSQERITPISLRRKDVKDRLNRSAKIRGQDTAG